MFSNLLRKHETMRQSRSRQSFMMMSISAFGVPILLRQTAQPFVELSIEFLAIQYSKPLSVLFTDLNNCYSITALMITVIISQPEESAVQQNFSAAERPLLMRDIAEKITCSQKTHVLGLPDTKTVPVIYQVIDDSLLPWEIMVFVCAASRGSVTLFLVEAISHFLAKQHKENQDFQREEAIVSLRTQHISKK